MTDTARKGMLVVAFAIGMTAEARAQDVRVALWARNDAAVPDLVLDAATRIVTQVLSAAGIVADWVPMPVPDRLTLTVAFVRHGLTRKSAIDNVLGIAAEADGRCGRIAYAFWDRVDNFATDNRRDAAATLAVVIAHELGHLLLSAGSHTSTGVMSRGMSAALVDDAESGRLAFTPSQGVEMLRCVAREPLRVAVVGR